MGVKWDAVIGRGSDRSSLRTGRQKWMYWTYGAHLYSDRKMDEYGTWAWDDISVCGGNKPTLEAGVFWT